jgi:hypothetical protein
VQSQMFTHCFKKRRKFPERFKDAVFHSISFFPFLLSCPMGTFSVLFIIVKNFLQKKGCFYVIVIYREANSKAI